MSRDRYADADIAGAIADPRTPLEQEIADAGQFVADGFCPFCLVSLDRHDEVGCCPCCRGAFRTGSNSIMLSACEVHLRSCATTFEARR